MKTTIQKNNAVTDESLERFGNMYFETNANGINIKLQIRGYTPTNEDDWHSEWCECDYSFSSGNWLNYHKEGDEAFLSIEVEGLARAFSDLLDNKITEVTEMTCAEPDFILTYSHKQICVTIRNTLISDRAVRFEIFILNGRYTSGMMDLRITIFP